MKILIVAGVLGATYLALLVLLAVFQEKLLFFPDGRPFEHCPEMKRLGAEAVLYGTSDDPGERIRYFHARPQNAQESTFRFIYFHGNSGNACDRAHFLEKISDLPGDFYFAEYPGFSGDSTSPTQASILRNARALLLEISQKSPKLPIILFGESLGTGVATFLASEFPVSGLMLQAPYTRISAVAKKHYPLFPVRLVSRNEFPSEDWAPNVKCPVIILHGTADRTIPIEIGRALAERFSKPPQFESFEGSPHNDVPYGDRQRYWSEIRKFILRSSRPSSEPPKSQADL